MNTLVDVEQSKDEVLLTTIALLSRLESEETGVESEETGVDGVGGPYTITSLGQHRVRRTIRKLVKKYSNIPSEIVNRKELRKAVYKLRLRRLDREVKELQQRRLDRDMRHQELELRRRQANVVKRRDRIVRQQALRDLVADEIELMAVRLRGSLATVFK